MPVASAAAARPRWARVRREVDHEAGRRIHRRAMQRFTSSLPRARSARRSRASPSARTRQWPPGPFGPVGRGSEGGGLGAPGGGLRARWLFLILRAERHVDDGAHPTARDCSPRDKSVCTSFFLVDCGDVGRSPPPEACHAKAIAATDITVTDRMTPSTSPLPRSLRRIVPPRQVVHEQVDAIDVAVASSAPLPSPIPVADASPRPPRTHRKPRTLSGDTGLEGPMDS